MVLVVNLGLEFGQVNLNLTERIIAGEAVLVEDTEGQACANEVAQVTVEDEGLVPYGIEIFGDDLRLLLLAAGAQDDVRVRRVWAHQVHIGCLEVVGALEHHLELPARRAADGLTGAMRRRKTRRQPHRVRRV